MHGEKLNKLPDSLETDSRGMALRENSPKRLILKLSFPAPITFNKKGFW